MLCLVGAFGAQCLGACSTTWETVGPAPVNLEALSSALQTVEERTDEIAIEEDRRLTDSPEDVALSLLDLRADKAQPTSIKSLATSFFEEAFGPDHDNDAVPEGVWRTMDEPWDPDDALMPAASPEARADGKSTQSPAAGAPQSARAARRAPVVPEVTAPALPPPPRATSGPALSSLSELDKRRTHYLRNTTDVVGHTITLHVPAAYARRIRWLAGTPQTLPTGGQRAEGGAELRLTNLTLKGGRITVYIRPDPDGSIQITSRGDAGFASRVQNRLVRESGLRTLLITNDRVMPLR